MTKPNCQEVFERLSEYIDGEMPDDLCVVLEGHIRDCAPCVEFVESLRKAKRLCREFKAAEEPGALDPAAREQMLKALRRCLSEG